MKITWYGTAALSLTDGKTKLLFDPYIRPNKKLAPIPLATYLGADAILVTHGHFDHIQSIPKIAKADENVPIYCTKTPSATLQKNGVAKNRIHEIAPQDRFQIGDFTVTVYQGEHIKYNSAYVAQVFPICFVKFPLVFKTEYYHLQMPENGEIVIYEVENNGKRVVIMGSFGSKDDVAYPLSPDLFVIPYGGNPDIYKLSENFINRLQPKRIMTSHYDNSFPPLTKRMNVEKFGEHLKKTHPEIKLTIPTEFKSYTV